MSEENNLVYLTPEQFEAYEYLLKQWDGKDLKRFNYNLIKQKLDPISWTWELRGFDCSAAHTIDTADFIYALHYGYAIKVRPQFEVGQWVTRTKDDSRENFTKGIIFQVSNLFDNTVVDSKGSLHDPDSLRLSTEEEIKWGQKGRKLFEWREDDIIHEKYSDVIFRIFSMLGADVILTRSFVNEQKFLSTQIMEVSEDMSDFYTLICFAEDRQDS